MKKILFLFAITCFTLIRCDGKDRVHRSNTEVLKEHKLLDSFSESIKYFPENFDESTIDTILSNGFRVKIKTLTDMEHSVLNEFKQDNIHNKHFYRDNKSTVIITKDDIIFDELIDKNFFLRFDNTLTDFFKVSILNGIWIDDEKSLLNSNISINVLFCKPETDWCEFFNITIENNGTFKIENITEEKDLN